MTTRPAMSDPFAEFAVWEEGPIGPDETGKAAGLYGHLTPPKLHMHIAGGHCTSMARQDRQGNRHPAVWLRLVAGIVGTGPRYHILTGMMDAEVAAQLGEILIVAAKQAALDIKAAS